MKNWVKASATTAFLTAGLFAFGMGAAHADVTTSGNGSIGGGNQIVGEADVPVNVCGNAVAGLVGIADASCVHGEAVVADDGYGMGDDVTTSGDGSILGGNQGVIDGDVPVNVTGNAVGIAGGLASADSVASDATVE